MQTIKDSTFKATSIQSRLRLKRHNSVRYEELLKEIKQQNYYSISPNAIVYVKEYYVH